MARLDKKELLKLTKLSRIECTEEESEKLLSDLQGILDHFAELDAVDTEGVAPCVQILEDVTSVLRDDLVGELLPRDLFLANAPAHAGGMIRVPPVIK